MSEVAKPVSEEFQSFKKGSPRGVGYVLGDTGGWETGGWETGGWETGGWETGGSPNNFLLKPLRG